MEIRFFCLGAMILMGQAAAGVGIQDNVEQCMVNVPHREVREFSYDDAQLLMRIAQAEAGNQGIKGMELVMAVVLNRTASEEFPDSIEEVIFQEKQFQPVTDGRFDTVTISTEAHLALAYIEAGAALDEDIVAFEITSNKRSLEAYFDYAYTVGGHDFYVSKKKDAAKAAGRGK